MEKRNLSKFPVHLGLGANIFSEPEFLGVAWYESYGERHSRDGKEGRLVSMHTFSECWSSWEMHPDGSELVVCTHGVITLIQELEGKHTEIKLSKGEYAINPPGVWHTADVTELATALFITSGLGTKIRDRKL